MAKPRAEAASTRQLRVAEEIRHVLSGVFARADFRHPDLAGERLVATEVRISPDLKHATAFICRLGGRDAGAVLPALRLAAPYLRAQVARAMRAQRHTPDLHFQADTALAYAAHMHDLLRSDAVRRDLEPRPAGAGDGREDDTDTADEDGTDGETR